MAKLRIISRGKPVPPGWVYEPWPVPYEVEYQLSNWTDCVDWLRAHPEFLLEKRLAWQE